MEDKSVDYVPDTVPDRRVANNFADYARAFAGRPPGDKEQSTGGARHIDGVKIMEFLLTSGYIALDKDRASVTDSRLSPSGARRLPRAFSTTLTAKRTMT